MPLENRKNELSFDWAKSGSWEQYEQELERVLLARKSAGSACEAMSSGATSSMTPTEKDSLPRRVDFAAIPEGSHVFRVDHGSHHNKDTALPNSYSHDRLLSKMAAGLPTTTPAPQVAPPTPDSPPPPAPGFMDQAKSFGSDMLGKATGAWNSMPTWGQGALIGGGVGALGGLLTDKKKTRGLLQGGLMGAGLGALGGYAYNQMGANKPPVDLNTPEVKSVLKSPAEARPGLVGEVTDAVNNTMIKPVSDTVNMVWNLPGSGTMLAGGALAGGGTLLHSLGKKNPTPFLGRGTEPPGGDLAKYTTQYTRPTAAEMFSHLQRSPDKLQSTIEALARQKIPEAARIPVEVAQSSAISPILDSQGRPVSKPTPAPTERVPLVMDPHQVDEAMHDLSRPVARPAGAGYRANVGGDSINYTKPELLKEFQSGLRTGNEGAFSALKSPKVMGVIPRKTFNTGLRTAGRVGQGAGAALAGIGLADSIFGGGRQALKDISSLDYTQQNAPAIVKALQSAPPAEAQAWIQNSSIPEYGKAQLYQTLGLRPQ